MTTILVCGGRNFSDVALLWKTLDRLHGQFDIRKVIDGASDDVTGPYVGADYWANQWALAHGMSIVRLHADWKKHGKAAGPIRNQRMLDEFEAHRVVAFEGGRGTADMVRRARSAGVPVTEVVEAPF